ncbi:SO2930 family diheme c-type cytochrome [Chitinophaga sp. Cy-1792]|uniref:SO2930 family diheme c-type cytochrome n=1 Tax=Chitinophaga sp. Cy-1792 TaxID=2608339 RepID=UPI0014239666|nr:SO2930 family diheme c-type cytochrome [Chitinophaga sp. Cy-1792]
MRKLVVAGVCLVLLYCCGQTAKQPVNKAFEWQSHLSGYHFFEGALKQLQPRNGVTGYDLATPLFTDYTHKSRFIALPKDSVIRYNGAGLPEFPDSTFIIKNFAFLQPDHQLKLIETRILFKDPADHSWRVMNYLWNEAQTDAEQWISGKRVPVTFLDDNGNEHTTTYQVPNTNDCKRCHINNSILTPIGPKVRNLNFTRKGADMNQLAQFASAGILKGLPSADSIARLPVWTDSVSFSVSERARAYLDVNCAHCHIRGGDAYNTGLFLDYEHTAATPGVMKEPVSAGGGAGGLNYDVIPGDAKHSILVYRMNSTEPGTAMPELARTVIHKEGVALITQWVNGLKK